MADDPSFLGQDDGGYGVLRIASQIATQQKAARDRDAHVAATLQIRLASAGLTNLEAAELARIAQEAQDRGHSREQVAEAINATPALSRFGNWTRGDLIALATLVVTAAQQCQEHPSTTINNNNITINPPAQTAPAAPPKAPSPPKAKPKHRDDLDV